MGFGVLKVAAAAPERRIVVASGAIQNLPTIAAPMNMMGHAGLERTVLREMLVARRDLSAVGKSVILQTRPSAAKAAAIPGLVGRLKFVGRNQAPVRSVRSRHVR